MKAVIEAIACAVPKQIVTNEDLERQNPDWDMEQVTLRSGVTCRHIAAANETAFDLTKNACEKLFSGGRFRPDEFDALLYCTQSPDYIMPPNAHLLHKHLKMPDRVMAFDFNLACSGFIYGLAMANAFILSGQATKVMLVTADTYSKYIHPKDRAARALFGDAAAITVIAADPSASGFSPFTLASHGQAYDTFYIPSGGLRQPKTRETSVERTDANGNVRTAEHIQMDGMAVWAFINSVMPGHIQEHLAKIGWTLNAIDHFIFHQASQMTLDSLLRKLEIAPQKAPTNLAQLGNTISASIPLCLRDSVRDKKIRIGDKILLSGFGVGLSYGTTTFTYEREIDVY